jgi:hypothetical protein
VTSHPPSRPPVILNIESTAGGPEVMRFGFPCQGMAPKRRPVHISRGRFVLGSVSVSPRLACDFPLRLRLGARTMPRGLMPFRAHACLPACLPASSPLPTSLSAVSVCLAISRYRSGRGVLSRRRRIVSAAAYNATPRRSAPSKQSVNETGLQCARDPPPAGATKGINK